MPDRRDPLAPTGEVVPDLDALRRLFREPGREFSPVPLWWWSGDPLDPERLRWQLERYVEGGVFNLVVMNLAPTGPLYGNPADDPPFMSERWWEIFRGVCADARELGVRLWFYDQIGFSGTNIQGRIIGERPRFAGWALERVSILTDGPADVACPSAGTPIAASWTPEDGKPEPVAIIDGVARYNGTGRGRLSLFYAVRRGFDYLDPDACAALIDTIHGEFERRAGDFLGTTIVGSFQDELPDVPTWGERFAGAFREAHGYDPVPWLDALWEDLGERGRRFRHDYHATRAALAEAAFFRPLFDWHEARGLLCGVDQQGPARAGDPKAGVRIYADYLRTHRWYSAPGSDHHGEAKIHVSLAHLYSRPRVWIEAFHSSGWGGTLEETFDWLLPWIRAGATLYDPHATYYSTRGGWFEWAPPSTDWRQPYWRHYRQFADAVARLCEVLSQGHHACDVGILHPTTTIQGGLGFNSASEDAERAHAISNALVGRMVWYDQRPGAMDRLGVDYDVLDEDSVVWGRVDGGALAIGEERFRTLILPGMTVLTPGIVERLVAFVDAGGELIAIGAPSAQTTREDDDPSPLAALRERFGDGRATLIPDVEGLGPVLAGREPLVRAPVPTLVRRVGAATLVFVPAASPGASIVHGNRGWIDFDRGRYAERMTIRVRGVSGAPRLWEPVSATERDDLRWRPDGDGVEVEIPFDGGPAAILVWSGEEPDRATPVDGTTGEEARAIDVEDLPWTCTVEPTLDNRWGDFTHPPGEGPFPVERWTFEHRTDDDDVDAWRPVVATFGPHARWAGPAAAEALRDLPADDLEWRVAEWSASRGIHKDPLHGGEPIGPSGHVPEEFLHFGEVAEGEAVRVVATLILDRDVTGWLAIGAAAAKRVRIDGAALPVSPDENARYSTMVPVTLSAGPHELDVLLTASRPATAAARPVVLRASVALVTDQGRYRRPERLTVGGEPQADSLVRFRRRIRIVRPLVDGRIQVASSAPCRILVDGREIGRQGGFMPYGDFHAIHPYDVRDALPVGDHDLALEVQDLGRPVSVMVDGVLTTATAENRLVTDTGWVADRDGALVRVGIDRVPRNDPAIAYLTQRPHPLPGARWLEGLGADDGTVVPLTWPASMESVTEWLRFLTPPGATSMRLPVVGAATVWLDGEEIGTRNGDGTGWWLDVPAGSPLPRECVVRVETRPGHSRGAILAGPVTFRIGEGAILPGDWAEQGLADYSGAVRYRRTLPLPEVRAGGRVVLDLGEVRGTAEVFVGGQSMGVRFLGPYRFDLTPAIAPGASEVAVEVLVTNTLAPYLDAVSPTPFVFVGQKVSGLLGPVRLQIA